MKMEKIIHLAPQRIKVSDTIISSSSSDIKPGNAMPFYWMPIGTIVHNVELKKEKASNC